jgi:dephospho-CoA kinase
MLCVGLTGGIASGKTAVADCFAELGCSLVDTDVISRDVVAVGEPGLSEVRKEFGSQVISDSGELDRRLMRTLIFADPQKRRQLEGILHPLIRARVIKKLDALSTPYAIVVVPLLIETGFASLVDRITVVDCPRKIQLDRLIARDGVDLMQAESILNTQAKRNVRLAHADDVINNGGNWENTHRRILELHARYSDLAKT